MCACLVRSVSLQAGQGPGWAATLPGVIDSLVHPVPVHGLATDNSVTYALNCHGILEPAVSMRAAADRLHACQTWLAQQLKRPWGS